MKEVTWTDPTTTPLEDLEAFRERIKHPVCEMCGTNKATGFSTFKIGLSVVTIRFCDECKTKM